MCVCVRVFVCVVCVRMCVCVWGGYALFDELHPLCGPASCTPRERMGVGVIQGEPLAECSTVGQVLCMAVTRGRRGDLSTDTRHSVYAI